ncbi:MAG: hypothetical protein N5P05_001207 [Chroococcopsis gigantea SAG 12.99]|jgi:Icc-related predicted phosphoesterase|nr:metallophosphoesterase [Chlorogloea purpurea SAG 13.99]MDV2999601.1 hypothetical protein [Chroococcopsis gigantea SAG 12.99]
MAISRRQFLYFWGGLSVLSLASCVGDRGKNNTVSNQTLVEAVNVPRKSTVRIVVISDLNSQYGSTTYEAEVDKGIAMIRDWKPDLVLCGGDMVAGQKRSLTRSQINDMWEGFDRHISAPLRKAKIPFGFTIGNHDASGALSGTQFIFAEERKLATAYWQNPAHDTGLNFLDRDNFPFNYSFTADNIFYLVWDASTHLISGEQLQWAGKSLNSQVARRAKMRIAIGHLPLYGIAIGRDKPGNFLAGGESLRQFLEKNGVHTYISGHAHAYYPGKRGQLQLLHTGALGSGPRRLITGDLPPVKTLTIVDINLDSQDTVYTTYNMKTMELIDIQTLPRFIDTLNGKVLRRDIEA